MRTSRYLLEASAIRAVEICRLLTLILREYRDSAVRGPSGFCRLITFEDI
ncbi:hypothetical protein PMI25_001615 [Pseudomonas sp. GM30]|nr:hypothetical protein PMI25_001615 [Pseudomonas sp. GM30]